MDVYSELDKAMDGIIMIASCAPHDDPDAASHEFLRIMREAKNAKALIPPKHRYLSVEDHFEVMCDECDQVASKSYGLHFYCNDHGN